MIKPQAFTAILEEKIIHNPKYTEFHFELKSPPILENLAGQYVMLDVPPNLKRAYSMCDRPDITHGFDLIVATAGQGKGVTYLESLPFGAEVMVLAPLGHFVFNAESDAKNLTFIATGSGIAPIKSIITDLLQNHQESRPIKLYWGMYEEGDFFWLDDMLDLQRAFPNFSFTPVVTNPSDAWTLSRGLVTDCLVVDGVQPRTDFYICGNPNMITDVVKLLTEQFEVVPSQIHREQF